MTKASFLYLEPFVPSEYPSFVEYLDCPAYAVAPRFALEEPGNKAESSSMKKKHDNQEKRRSGQGFYEKKTEVKLFLT